MSNRKIQAEEAIKKRLRNPEAVLGTLKERLATNREWLAEFMEMSKDEKRKKLRRLGYTKKHTSDMHIKKYTDTITSLEKAIASPQTTEVLPADDMTTLWRGIQLTYHFL